MFIFVVVCNQPNKTVSRWDVTVPSQMVSKGHNHNGDINVIPLISLMVILR